MNVSARLTTKADAAKLQALLDQNPTWTPAELARQLGRCDVKLARFMRLHGIKPGVRFTKKPMRANGLLGKVLGELDRTHLQKEICNELQICRNRLSAWRMGHRDVPLTMFECLAQMAGYRIVLEPIEEDADDGTARKTG